MCPRVSAVLKEYKPVIAICVIVLILIGVVWVFVAVWPRYEESFFELGLLGEGKKAEDYYPSDDPNINVSSRISWYIYIHNYMHSVQDVVIRVKLLNSTMQAPDDRGHVPSPYPVLAEFPVHLDVDEVLLLPFSWSVSDLFYSEDLVAIDRLVINDVALDAGVSSIAGKGFRMVFELWVYDQGSQQYEFGWDSEKGYCSASLNMWFNMTLPG